MQTHANLLVMIEEQHLMGKFPGVFDNDSASTNFIKASTKFRFKFTLQW